MVGENWSLEFQLANLGRNAAFLVRMEGILPEGFDLMEEPEIYRTDNSHLDMKGRRLDPLKTEVFRLVLASFEKGTFSVKPKVIYVDEVGHQMCCEPEPVTMEVSEVVLPGHIATGFRDLDTLLFGGIPENYAVILTSPSCDERDLLIRKFLEAGAGTDEVTFYFTVDPRGMKTLIEGCQSNLYVFICNPRADEIMKTLPNVFKLKGVENLTDINIALTSAFRSLDSSSSRPRRACIEIVSDILLQHHAVSARRWLRAIIPELRSRGFTTLAVINPYMHPPEEAQAVLDIFEGEVALYEKEGRKGSERFLRIKKMYNQKYLSSELPLRKKRLMTEKQGN
jgi:KaiC/GvpD/RAD55 family RecA-like ATPase